MSTKKHTNPAYISHVHLKGYKSIIDTEVELHSGLNIIIGPNGSGKTNFLEFFYNVISTNLNELNNSRAYQGLLKANFESYENECTYTFEKIFEINNTNNKVDEILIEKLVDGKELKMESGDELFSLFPSILNHFRFWDKISPAFIKHGLSIGIQNLAQSLSFEAEILDNSKDFNFLGIRPNFIPKISRGVEELLKSYFYKKIYKDYDLSFKSVDVFEGLDLFGELNGNLKKFSPIHSIRILPTPSLLENKPLYRADFLNFEFFVEDKWLRWNQLSDGTKRIFFIISEVTLNTGLCLIEEPELGVHPNQYRKILNFLKEQSEDKQIIITTHAPKTLDILNDSELDRIILTRYDNLLGTKMRHLNKEEINHAVKYMLKESLFLSDFWTLTSFFDEEKETV